MMACLTQTRMPQNLNPTRITLWKSVKAMKVA